MFQISVVGVERLYIERGADDVFRRPRLSVNRKEVSGEDIFHHMSGDIRQPEIAALETIRQLFMFDPQRVQHRRMQIVNLHRRRHRVIAEIVRLSIAEAGFDPAAGQPPHKVVAVMIAPDIRVDNTLRKRSPPNSLPHITRVSLSKPRCFKSATRAAEG